MTHYDLTCIRCPLGCSLSVDVENGQVVKVEGYNCNRGLDYAHKEVLNPTRTITTTVPLKNGTIRMVPVKTSTDVPKGKITDCLEILRELSATAPVHVGDILIENIADTGANIVATRTIPVKK